MSLADHAIWYHVYPLGALGAPVHERGAEVVHRLGALEPWLDHAVGLGCSGLLLGPIFTSVSHGYDTLDHYSIDPRLGDDGDFDALVAACRERGLSLMLDGVFNHVSTQHGLVGEDSPMLRRSNGYLYTWEGHDNLVELDHTRADVADWITGIMLHWLRRGIAGWRLDVAYAVAPEFWREVIARVRREFPDALFLGEVIHGDYDAIAEAATFDSVTAYELWKATWSSIKDTNCWELAHALERHRSFSANHVLNTFVGNHDVDRIASLVGGDGAALAASVLFTVPGMPSVYYGDEQGFTAVRGTGLYADDAVRPPLPATPADLLPTGAWLETVYRDLIGFRRRHAWLSRGHLAVVAKENAWIEYAVTHGDDRVDVRLELEPTPRVVVRASDGETWGWSA